MGVELFDFADKSVVKAGDHRIDSTSRYTNIQFATGERIIGIKCGRRGQSTAKNYDV